MTQSPLHRNVILGCLTLSKRPLTNQDSLIIFLEEVRLRWCVNLCSHEFNQYSNNCMKYFL